MGYAETHLMTNEHIIHSTKVHWIVFVRPLIVLVLAGGFFTQQLSEYGIVLLALGVIDLLRSLVLYTSSEFVLTDRRVLMKTGFLQRSSLELLLTKVESLAINQGLLGRMLGYGTLVLIGSGGTRTPFSSVQAPLEFRRHVQQQIG